MSEQTLLHEHRLDIRWGDMDALGHVNNVIYFRYFEQARASWLATIGDADSINTASEGPLIITADATYLKPVVYPATLIIRMLGEAPGRSSFNIHYEIRNADDPDTLYTTGNTKVVWADQKAAKSIPVPDHIRQLLPDSEK
ncbi:MAG: acyl-CoA thioesterase [Pseudomonadota bacterium]